MAFDDSDYPVSSNDNAIDKEAVLRRLAAQFGITPPAPTTPPLLSLNSQQQPAQSRPLLSLSSSSPNPQPDANAGGSLLRPSNPSPAPAPTPAKDALNSYLAQPQKTAADFAPKPLHGWAKFASFAVPAAVGFAGGYEKRPELGLQVAEGMQDRRTADAQRAYQNYEAGQQRQGGLLEKQYEMERQGPIDTLNQQHVGAEISQLGASAEKDRADAEKARAEAKMGGKGAYKVMMDPSKPGEPIGVMLRPNGETTDLGGNPVTGLVPFEKDKNKEAITLDLGGGKKVAGKKDSEGNLLLANGKPAPPGATIYQQPSYAIMQAGNQAKQDVDKYSADYTKAAASRGELRDLIKSGQAADPNQISNSLANMAGGLMVTTAAGVHRINTTEMEAWGGKQGLSWGEQINKWLDQGAKGAVPPEIAKAWGSIVDIYAKRSYAAYLSSAKVAAQLGGLSGDIPVANEDGTDTMPLSQAMSGSKANSSASGGKFVRDPKNPNRMIER